VNPYVIEIFSYEWFYTNLVSFSLIASFLILISVVLSKVADINKWIIFLSKFLGCIFLFRFIFSQVYQIYNNLWYISYSLPLHLCGISVIVSIVVLLRFNQNLYEFLFFIGFPGAIWSFLTPQINIYDPGMLFDNPGYMYIDYFVSHATILFVPLYLTFFSSKKPRSNYWYKIFLKSNFFIIPVIFLINLFIYHILGVQDVNYIYLMNPPGANNLFIIGGWPWYIIMMEIACFVHAAIINFLFVRWNDFINFFSLKKELLK
tara:strand:+ start:1255 stop:2037 length:783 start_codon:yes stop_codon:yes gene_type:complete